jgi:uncharacterized membrane protein
VPELIAITYPADTLAAQAAAELGRVAAEILLDPDAVAVIISERDGSSQMIASRHPGTPAGWSRFWGVFFGDLANGGGTSEIDEGFRHRVKQGQTPGTSTVFVAIDRITAARVLDAVSQYGGQARVCPIPADLTAGLWAAQDETPVGFHRWAIRTSVDPSLE